MTSTLSTKYRTVTLVVTERPEKIVLTMSVTRLGELGDEAEMAAWGEAILTKWNKDPRPIEFHHPLTGEIALVFNNAAFIFDGPKS